MKKTIVATFLAVVLTACASVNHGPPPFDPVGTYSYIAEVEGIGDLSGTISIEGSEGAYEGQITNEMGPALAISEVTVAGQNVTISADGPDGPLTIVFLVTDNALSGSWAMGPMGGNFSGTKTN